MDVKFSGTETLDRILAGFSVAPEIVALAQYLAVNYAASKAMTAARRKVVEDVNLTQAYVRERMELFPATHARPVAVIKARRRATTLMRYAGRQVTRAAKGAKGDPRRGIPAGRKAAGVSVQVKARASGGIRRTMPGAFLLPLRAGAVDGGNGWGIFVREGTAAFNKAKATPGIQIGKHRAAGGLRHLYGPSVDQVFRTSIPDLKPAIRADLEKETRRLLALELKKAFSR